MRSDGVRRQLAAVKAVVKRVDPYDVGLWAGAALVAIGTGLIYHPAGLIVGGLGLIWISFMGAVGRRKAG